jgi:hypothetical protein
LKAGGGGEKPIGGYERRVAYVVVFFEEGRMPGPVTHPGDLPQAFARPGAASAADTLDAAGCESRMLMACREFEIDTLGRVSHRTKLSSSPTQDPLLE